MATRPLTFSAGEQKTLGGGLFLKITSSTDPVDIELLSNNGTTIETIDDVLQGDGFNVPDGFAQAKVKSATAQTVVFQVLNVLMQSNNLVGNVGISSIPDQIIADDNVSLNRVQIDNNVFTARMDGNLLAGQYAYAQIGVPAGSTKKVLIERCLIIGDFSTFFYHGTSQTDLVLPSKSPGSNHHSFGGANPVDVLSSWGNSATFSFPANSFSKLKFGYEPIELISKDSPVLLESTSTYDAWFQITSATTSMEFNSLITYREIN